LLLSVMLLFLSIREGIGLLDADYRAAYEASSEGGWILATRAFGLVVAVVVLAAMLRTPQRPLTAPRRYGRLFVIAGVSMLAAGAAKLLYMGYALVEYGVVGQYLRQLVDPSDYSPLSMESNGTFYEALLMVAMLVVGVLALRQRGVARAASLPLMGVTLYVLGYLLIGVLNAPFGVGTGEPVLDLLFWLAATLPVAAALVVLPIMALAGGGDDEPPALDPAGFAPLPGHVSEQHTGGH
jgi:hypothetical protein